MEGFVSIGTVEDALDSAYSGFAYPAHKKVIRLLGDDASAGNSVLMSGSLGYREASLTLVALTTAEKDALRGYEETSETVTFVDHDTYERDVVVLQLRASLRPGNVWEAALALQELTEPVLPGS
jgi:hypothetical protein